MRSTDGCIAANTTVTPLLFISVMSMRKQDRAAVANRRITVHGRGPVGEEGR
jgi:hypothetical protein